MLDPIALPDTLRARALTRQADWAPKSEVGLVECGLLNPGPPARPPVRPSARPPVRPSARPAVRVSAPRGPRRPVRSTVRTLSAAVYPTVHSLSAPSAHLLVRPSASSAPVRPSARPLRARIVRHIRPVRSARSRQPPLYIPHPSSPQIIQLLAVRVGPQVSVAPLRTAALRGAQGLREVGVNCGRNPCNFFLRSK